MNRLMEAMSGYSTDRVAGIHGELVVRSNTGNNKGQLYNKVIQTGEDKIAEIIRQKYSRARLPFVKINCGALPAGTARVGLFGHVKGAFTGASRNKRGMFSLADKWTLFLTEIGDMPLPLLVKLLTVLDDREFIPVGGEQKVSVDVRTIAATHRLLREQVCNSTFREDLFYRLNVLHIHLPPLRERDADVRYLLDYFLARRAGWISKAG